ncbi:MAG: hypothetical protein KC478_11085 [Bacteriovoracaceae bacterium]|nr:hypothetical protein [Bacteriovoracaceae bacterium]
MDEDFKIKTILLNARGQMTIFFATTVLALITFIAFIINIGIFVKAKINLQNAVDAAAFAGASVQARQLSNISYLNWEMRNVYKEWMFKTYVLGNLSLDDISGPAGNPVNFRMEPHSTNTEEVQDGYNVPSVCLDFKSSGSVSVCKKALIPGLPRFARSDVLGMEETMDSFIDALSDSKAKDCSRRSNINFLTNFIWAYNVVGVPELMDFTEDAPEVAADRMGAFPDAFNLALRIRSLEAQVNKSPYERVCAGNAPGCSQDINNIVSSEQSPANERVYKAFYSAFRNLGAQDCGEGSSDELKCTFKLTELPPRLPNLGGPFTLSNLLIPDSTQARNKYYLDLKLMPVNYATFFTLLAAVSTDNGIKVTPSSGGTLVGESTAECVATKVGMPVPGYPLGFAKNPDVLTYYAVKGESEFVGLFNPFASQSIKLTAYAAAKPFGGRVGPMIFNVSHSGGNPSYLLPRAPHYKTSPYVSALDNTNPVDRSGNIATTDEYQEGMPIPGNYGGVGGGFWLKDETTPIGGWIDSGSIFFAVPNIPYDYQNSSPADSSHFAGTSVEIIKPTPKGGALTSTAGLYNGNIFTKLKSNLQGLGAGAQISVSAINDAILSARAPTLYDTTNYLVPTPEDLNRETGVDSYGVILNETTASVGDNTVYDMSLYAPLIDGQDPNALYRGTGDLVNILQEYLARQEQAILKYRGSMNLASQLIYKKNFSSRTRANYGLAAAKTISDIGDSSTYNSSDASTVFNSKPGCRSINGKFIWFFTSNPNHVNHNGTDCQTKNTLQNLMQAHWNNLSSVERSYYVGKFSLPDSDIRNKLYTAYRPGAMSDANAAGEHLNFFTGARSNMNRNFYSSKFVTLNSVSDATGEETFKGNFALFSEGIPVNRGAGDTQGNFKNTLIPQELNIDLSQIQH